MKTMLNGNWRLYIEENKNCADYADSIFCEKALRRKKIKAIDAVVPGNFELDMYRAGLIDDPFYSQNPHKLYVLENRHLWYVRDFTVEDKKNVKLTFCGIDTVADVYVNGVLIGSPENMFIEHRFAVAESLLKNGKNELLVHIKPAVIEARKHKFDADVITHLPYNAGSLNLRKASHMFGWDIMPRFVSGGLWRDVYIENEKCDRIDDIYIYTAQLEDGNAYMHGLYTVTVSDDYSTDYSLEICGKCGDSEFLWKQKSLWHTQGKIIFTVENPVLWWPRDMGEQSMYDVKATLKKRGETVDTKELKVGIRTVRLNRTETIDENGNGEFVFMVNGEKFFARGTNWVPMDAFHSRDKERLPNALEMLYDINCNMVRCWGGNVYEDHEFFDFCDTHGILVWQDFAMGCAAYPQNDRACEMLKAEAESVVKKLRMHPSIALWAGDNECDAAASQWTKSKRNPALNKLTREVLPRVIADFDPSRDFLASSPYVSSEGYLDSTENSLPEAHLWGPRDYYKGDFYTTSPAYFASETGYHGCPSPESIKKFIPEDKLWPWQDNDDWQVHATCMELGNEAEYSFRNPLMASQIEVLFGFKPETLEDFALASQISQSEAKKFFIERFRTAKWRRTGLIWWNLVDGWPQFSDAIVDYYYCKKLAYSTIKRIQEPVCLMVSEEKKDALTLVAANEYLVPKTVKYKVTDFTDDAFSLEGEFTIDANSAKDLDIIKPDDKNHFYFIEWTVDGKTCKNHYISGPAPYNFTDVVNWLKRGDLLEIQGF